MRPSWFKISAILASLWLVVGSALWWLESRRPSVEKLLAFVGTHPTAGKGEAERKAAVDAVSAEYLRLNFDDRREVLLSPDLRQWWQALSEPQRKAFRMAIFPQSRRMVDFFDQLPLGQKQHHLQRLEQEIVKTRGELKPLEKAGLAMMQTLGIKVFFESHLLDQSEETLLFFHEMEKRFIWSRGR